MIKFYRYMKYWLYVWASKRDPGAEKIQVANAFCLSHLIQLLFLCSILGRLFSFPVHFEPNLPSIFSVLLFYVLTVLLFWKDAGYKRVLKEFGGENQAAYKRNGWAVRLYLIGMPILIATIDTLLE